MAIILGIDPGSRITGYGIIDYTNRIFNYLASGCIRAKSYNINLSLNIIYSELTEIINNFTPNYCAIERIFIAKNPDSALKLGYARGAAIVAVNNFKLPIFEYAASQIKQSVVGMGNANKKQVQYMVRNLLNLSINPQVDAADALAIAITHCYRDRSH